MRRPTDALLMLRQVSQEMDATLHRMRAHFLPTDRELRERIWGEVEEEFRPEPPSQPPPGGPRWMPAYLANWFPWQGRKGKRRWHT